jgi:hypothetical protein
VEWIPLPKIKIFRQEEAGRNLQLQMSSETHFKKCSPDHAYVPYADGISQAWGMQRKPEGFFFGRLRFWNA